MEAIERARRAAVHVVGELRQAGHVAYLVGGCVRDELRGVRPREFDVATSAHPPEVEALFPRTVAVGRSFGVVVVVHDGVATEVATFRSDGAYVDGRRPSSVEYGSVEEDARRRDFTVNALYLDPTTGEILDLVGGRDDLRQGVLRAIGDAEERFAEDHLRLLRAVRFGASGPFLIADETWEALVAGAELIRGVAAERVGHELERILVCGRTARGLELLQKSGLAAILLPELDPPLDLEPFRALDADGPARLEDALALLLRGVAPEAAEEVVRRLRRPSAVAEGVAGTIRAYRGLADVAAAPTAERHAFLESVAGGRALALARRCGETTKAGPARELSEAAASLREHPLPPGPLIQARRLLEHGYRPGRRIGKLLATVEERRLDRRLDSEEEALAWLLANHPPDADPAS